MDKSDDIDTNRPSFSQSALTVPQGSLQLENGTLYQGFQHGLTYYDIPENEVRLGILKKTELQIYSPNLVLLNQSGSTCAGLTGLSQVGIKQQIGPVKRLTVSLVGGVNIPTGSKRLSGSSVNPYLSLPFSVSLSKNWSLGGMQSIIVQQPHSNISWQPFLMLSRTLGARSSVFAEYAGFFTQNSQAPGLSIAHFGGVHKFKKNQQIDLHFGFGLSKTAPTGFIGLGYSYRFDGLPWGNKALKRLDASAEQNESKVESKGAPPP